MSPPYGGTWPPESTIAFHITYPGKHHICISCLLCLFIVTDLLGSLFGWYMSVVKSSIMHTVNILLGVLICVPQPVKVTDEKMIR